MKKIFSRELADACLKQTKYESYMKDLREQLFVIQYTKGELVTSPLQEEPLFQIVIRGSLNIYFIRDDGSVHSLSTGQENYLLGEMEIFSSQVSSVYAEAEEDLTCLAFPIEASRPKLMESPLFLQLLCRSLTEKLAAITTIDAAPASLKQRVLTYMEYKCGNGELKGLQQAAFHLNCSSRQLQRILNQYEEEGTVVRIGKGAYRLLSVSRGLRQA